MKQILQENTTCHQVTSGWRWREEPNKQTATIPSTKVFKLLQWSKANLAILHGDTRGAATHIAYLRFDTIRGVARDREHGLFALEISERLSERNINRSATTRRDAEILAPRRDSGSLPSLEAENGIRIEVIKGRSGRTLSYVMPPRRI
jgi:hypothetical protein